MTVKANPKAVRKNSDGSENESGSQEEDTRGGENKSGNQEKDADGSENESGNQEEDAGDSENMPGREDAHGREIEDPEQVLRVLEMLEKLEEESLKNNQGIVIEGEESKYGW